MVRITTNLPKLASVLILTILTAMAVQAQTDYLDYVAGFEHKGLPTEVIDIVKQAVEVCHKERPGKSVRMYDGFFTKKDVNGDGIVDYKLDYNWLQCDANELWCGPGYKSGCKMQVLVSVNDGSYKLVYDDVVTDINFAKVKRLRFMVPQFYESMCTGRKFPTKCEYVYVWDGTDFVDYAKFKKQARGRR
jgi:hypothetical protein